MPVVVAWIAEVLTDIGVGTAAAGVGYSALAYSIATVIVDVAVSVVVSKVTQALAGKLSPTQNMTPLSRTLTARGTMEFRQLIYGQVRTGGFLAYYGSSIGADRKFLLELIDAE